jgi:hypothetical protein
MNIQSGAFILGVEGLFNAGCDAFGFHRSEPFNPCPAEQFPMGTDSNLLGTNRKPMGTKKTQLGTDWRATGSYCESPAKSCGILVDS